MACITTNDINGHKIVQLALETCHRTDSLPSAAGTRRLVGMAHAAAQPVAKPPTEHRGRQTPSGRAIRRPPRVAEHRARASRLALITRGAPSKPGLAMHLQLLS